MALILYGIVSLIEKRLLKWQQQPEKEVLLSSEVPIEA
jgi:hypothetical protein